MWEGWSNPCSSLELEDSTMRRLRVVFCEDDDEARIGELLARGGEKCLHVRDSDDAETQINRLADDGWGAVELAVFTTYGVTTSHDIEGYARGVFRKDADVEAKSGVEDEISALMPT